jgi:glyoxylase I family protein
MPRLQGSNHVSLHVTDLARSVEWYHRVFAAVVVADETTTAPATFRPLRYRGMFVMETMTQLVGLVERSDGDLSPFDERRIGLDHLALHVPERSDLETWVRHLDKLGIAHSAIKSVDYADAVTFRDPDNIQLEVFWPNTEFWTRRLTSALTDSR